MNDLFPTNYLKAADFEDGDAILTIAGLEQQTLGQGRDAAEKWIVYFREVDKGLVLNKTNAGTIAKLYGDDTDDWIGKKVTLYSTEVQFQSEMVEAIRIRSKMPKGGGKKPVLPASAEEDDADVPF